MKNILLHIILFSYAIVMFKPAFPYVEDFFAHVMFYNQHMETIHLENGRYHVHAEVVKNVKEEDDKKNSDTKKQSSSTDHVLVLQKSLIADITLITVKYPLNRNAAVAIGNPSCHYPPPRI